MKNSINERRKTKRMELKGLIADIADRSWAFNGWIDDISPEGFKVSYLSPKFTIHSIKYVTAISEFQNIFKIIIKPCWNKKVGCGYYQEVGFKVINPPYEWSNFILDKRVLV